MDTKGRWEEARERFLELADLDEDERARSLDALAARDEELAGWVRDLLRNDSLPSESAAEAATPGESRRFGPYEVVRPIGEGGMGRVFVARRADGEYESEVAVKLLREGTGDQELVRRFLRERQTLARLDHEYIARLLDGGTSEAGEPYLVMEYVEGEPADVFAARLELRERLELFRRIGQAVSHAHERGFVHRDLKPSNILVRADGTPRLLDFGIARPDGETRHAPAGEAPLTRTGHRVFTPEYASPEQVRGEIATVQSDVFALGVLLYVFLCGELPWKELDSLHALERSIVEDEPAPPSRRVSGTTRRRISGDLDAIVQQCLAKRPNRRYASVEDLCEDVERHLAGLPIRARRTGTFGRVARFARRKPAYPVVGVLLVLVLAATWIATEAQAREERRRDELLASVGDRIESARVRWADGKRDSAFEELDLALTSLEELPEERALLAEVLVQKAVFSNLALELGEARELLDRSAELLAQVEEPDPAVVLTHMNVDVYVLQRARPNESHLEKARVALEFARLHVAPGEVLRIDAILGWADELRAASRVEDALEAQAEAADELRAADPKHETLSRVLNERAVVLAAVGRLEEAVRDYEEAIEVLSWHQGGGHESFYKVRLNLAATLFRLGRYDEARREFELSLVGSREHGEDLIVASNQHFLGRIFAAQGDLDAAEAAALEAIEIRERVGLAVFTERSRCLLGIVYAKSGRGAEARALLEPVLEDPRPNLLLPDMREEASALLTVLNAER